MSEFSLYSELLSPSSAERYQLTELLAEGGMGAVFRAWDTQLVRSVIIKFPRIDIVQHKSKMKRFAREAYALARLDHPNIVRLFDYVKNDERPFIVTEDVSGTTINELMAKDTLDYEQKFQLLLELAEGIYAVHQSGILHRDIKPGNVVVTPDGRPKLIDFGLSLILDVNHMTRMTVTGHVVGTLAFLAPELAFGDCDATAKSDIFSFGILAYALFSGVHPYRKHQIAELCDLDVPIDVEPLSSWCPEVSQELNSLVMKMIARDENNRPKDVAAIVRTLSSIQNKTERDEVSVLEDERKDTGNALPISVRESCPTQARTERPFLRLISVLSLVCLLLFVASTLWKKSDHHTNRALIAQNEKRVATIRDELLRKPSPELGPEFYELASLLPQTRFVEKLGIDKEGVPSNVLALLFMVRSTEKRAKTSIRIGWYEKLLSKYGPLDENFSQTLINEYIDFARHEEMLPQMASFVNECVKRWEKERADKFLTAFIKKLLPPRKQRMDKAHRKKIESLSRDINESMSFLATKNLRASFDELFGIYVEYISYCSENLEADLFKGIGLLEGLPLAYWPSRIAGAEALATLFDPPQKYLNKAIRLLDDAKKGAPPKYHSLISIRRAFAMTVLAAKQQRFNRAPNDMARAANSLAEKTLASANGTSQYIEVLLFRILTLSRTIYGEQASKEDAQKMARLLEEVEPNDIQKDKMYLYLYAKAETLQNGSSYGESNKALEEAINIAPYRYKRGMLVLGHYYKINLGLGGGS